MQGVERIGNFEVRPMGDGRYSFHTTVPGHMGAGILQNEEQLKAFRAKYSLERTPEQDTVTISGKDNEEAAKVDEAGYKKTKAGRILGFLAGTGGVAGAALYKMKKAGLSFTDLVKGAATYVGRSTKFVKGSLATALGITGLLGFGIGAIVDKCINNSRKKQAQTQEAVA